ncbi:MAG TPA: DUF6065 family protein [Gemmataceae bacterium]|nr:DUF6065 family protein [Gemmataceae bacterium]
MKEWGLCPTNDARLIRAYEIHDPRDMPIVCAPARRDWMDAIGQLFPYRCLPLVMPNQAGWLILNPVDFTARWNGRPGLDNLHLLFGPAAPADPVGFQVCAAVPPPLRRAAHGGYLSAVAVCRALAEYCVTPAESETILAPRVATC